MEIKEHGDNFKKRNSKSQLLQHCGYNTKIQNNFKIKYLTMSNKIVVTTNDIIS